MIKPQNIDDCHLVTHVSCMDGAGCAIMFLASGGKRENVHFIAAGTLSKFIKKDPLWKSDRFIIFADVGLNVNEAGYTDTMEKRGNCVVVDHHSTSRHMESREWTYIDMDACGSELLRRYLVLHGFMFDHHPLLDSYRKLANIIDDFDRFVMKDQRSDDMSMLMTFYGQQKFIDKFQRPYLRFQDENFWTELENEILPILTRKRREAIDKILKRVKVRDVTVEEFFHFPVRIAYVVTGDPNISMLLDEVLRSNPDCMMACSIDPDRTSVSLRSRGEFDVSEFAGLFGGGGHKQAAGHHMNMSLFDELVDGVHDLQNAITSIERVR